MGADDRWGLDVGDEAPRASAVRPCMLDLGLLAVGLGVTGLGMDMFTDSLWLAPIGLAVGCVLAVAAWFWPRYVTPLMIVVAVPVVSSALMYAAYTIAVPQSLVAVWGSAAFVVGIVGIMRRRWTVSEPGRHVLRQVLSLGGLAVLMIAYSLVFWPMEGRAILMDLPMAKDANVRDVDPEAGGIWAAYWGTPRVGSPAVVATAKAELESDGWTVVSAETDLSPIVSAQRGEYSVEVMYVSDAPLEYWPTGAYMAAYVRKAPARRFDIVP